METSSGRVRRSIAEKRRIVELTLESGQSVARVAQAEGVNSHQVFQWRRLYRQGGLQEPGAGALLPVVVTEEKSAAAREGRRPAGRTPRAEEPAASSSNAIHIELPGRALISVEGGADAAMLRTILEVLRG
jgi:transposase